ncbi:hypothetical protein [Dietzia sp. B32]|uniref:hypothetical protein n=1 Tax=Dietzia sp. B32 TaxID=2915130 RepID=UPI0021AE28C2|nr:hypothetical protein [Dietzia sp. B32]UVE95620.1 hypothetical protein L8M95_02100 [Dietzia sp. B32]
MPHSAPVVLTRRHFVVAAAGVAGLAAAGGCALPTVSDRPDPLLGLLDAAQRDARELAAADASHGERVGALRRIADVRRLHAERLTTIVEFPADEGRPTPASTPAPVCPPADEVRARLRVDAAGATDAAAAEEGPRAEIAGAIAAACTAAAEVELA